MDDEIGHGSKAGQSNWCRRGKEVIKIAFAASVNGTFLQFSGRSEGRCPGAVVDDEIDQALSFWASFTILAVFSIISESSMPLTIFSNGKAFWQDSRSSAAGSDDKAASIGSIENHILIPFAFFS
jgi:hypothetical protein